MRNYKEQEQKLRFQMEYENSALKKQNEELSRLNDELRKWNDVLSVKYESIIDGYITKQNILTETLQSVKYLPIVLKPDGSCYDYGGSSEYYDADDVRRIITEGLLKVTNEGA